MDIKYCELSAKLNLEGRVCTYVNYVNTEPMIWRYLYESK
jgi:hypothetical protein